jgi:hypothetical protein
MKVVVGTALVALLLASPGPVLALGTETFGNAPAVKQPEWAEGVLDVVNLKSRVYSYWVNGNEIFFYRGNAWALNEALRKYAAVHDDVRQLVLLPGRAKTQTFQRTVVEFDWQLHVPSGIYRAVSKRTHAVLTVYVNAARPRAVPDTKAVEQWLGALNSNSFRTRDKARQELQKLGNDAKPLLREALKAQPAPEARRAIQGLLERLQDYDVGDLEVPQGLRVVSVDDLLAAGLKGLKDGDANVCAMAAQELSSLAPYSDKVVPALTALLQKDKNEYVRRVAAGCLSHMGIKARPAVPALKEGLKDPDANIRAAFQAALDEIAKAKATRGQAQEVKRQLAILNEIRQLRDRGRGPQHDRRAR